MHRRVRVSRRAARPRLCHPPKGEGYTYKLKRGGRGRRCVSAIARPLLRDCGTFYLAICRRRYEVRQSGFALLEAGGPPFFTGRWISEAWRAQRTGWSDEAII